MTFIIEETRFGIKLPSYLVVSLGNAFKGMTLYTLSNKTGSNR